MPIPLPLNEQPTFDEDALRQRQAELESLPPEIRTEDEATELTSIKMLLGFAQELHDDALSNTF